MLNENIMYQGLLSPSFPTIFITKAYKPNIPHTYAESK